MKHKLTTILLFCFVLTLPLIAADKNSSSTNPLLGKFNETIPFADLTAEYIKEATDVSIKEARESLQNFTQSRKPREHSTTQCSSLITFTTKPGMCTDVFI